MTSIVRRSLLLGMAMLMPVLGRAAGETASGPGVESPRPSAPAAKTPGVKRRHGHLKTSPRGHEGSDTDDEDDPDEKDADEASWGNVFGFTQNADTADAGSRELDLSVEGRFTKRRGSYRALSQESALEYGLTDRVQIAASAFTAGFGIAGVPHLDPRSSFGFDGGGLTAKVSILKRGPDGPVGLAVETAGEFHRYDDTSGDAGRFPGLSATAMADLELIPNALFVGANIGSGVERGFEAGGASDRSSSLFGSLALTGKFSESVLLGGEARLQRAFGGAFDQRDGVALFIGPDLTYKASPDLSVSLGWDTQAWGDGRGGLNLRAFQRHSGFLSLSYGF